MWLSGSVPEGVAIGARSVCLAGSIRAALTGESENKLATSAKRQVKTEKDASDGGWYPSAIHDVNGETAVARGCGSPEPHRWWVVLPTGPHHANAGRQAARASLGWANVGRHRAPLAPDRLRFVGARDRNRVEEERETKGTC